MRSVQTEPASVGLLDLLGLIADCETSLCREGITKAKAEGAYKGRKPTSRARSADVAALSVQGRSVRAIAEALGISVGSVHGVPKVPAETVSRIAV